MTVSRKSDAQFAVYAANHAGNGARSLIEKICQQPIVAQEDLVCHTDDDRLVKNLQFALDAVAEAHGYLIGRSHSGPLAKCRETGCLYKEAGKVLRELIGLRKAGRLTVINTPEQLRRISL